MTDQLQPQAPDDKSNISAGKYSAGPGTGSAPPGGSADLTGRQIGRYIVGRRLGSGGAAVVYQAYDQVRGVSVALKVLMPGADPMARSRFRQEARTAGTLNHPHIVRILQVGDSPSDGIAYIAMELIEGESLARLLERKGRLSPEESCNLLEPIARALAHAHEVGIVHRDVKPSNILLQPASPGMANTVQLEALDYPVLPLLTDFGIAKALDMPELTSVGRTIGTPAYMAPEQCAGNRELDGRADVYSLGAVLYRCIVGRPPFAGTTTQILHAHVYESLTIPDDILSVLPPLVVEILRKSLAKIPSERYESAVLMAIDLAIAAGRPQAVDDLAAPTATMTLASLPVLSGHGEPSTTETILVPAPTGSVDAISKRRQPARQAAIAPGRTNGSRWATTRPGARLGRLLVGLAGIAALILVAIVLITAGNRLPSDATAGLDTPLPARETKESTAPPPTAVGPAPQNGGAPAVAALPPTKTPITQPSPTVLPSPTAEPSATATPEPTPTPTALPTATPVPVAEPTAVASPTPATDPGAVLSCSGIVDRFFLDFYNSNPDIAGNLGCPSGVGQETVVEIQPFQRGLILNRLDARVIYVVYANGDWAQFTDSWNESMPVRSDNPELAPPEIGLFQPERGIGKLWADNPVLRGNVGWATAPAEQFTGMLQSFTGGLLLGNQATGDTYVFLRSRLRL